MTDFVVIAFNFIVFDFIALFVMFMLNLIHVLTSFLTSDVPDALYFNKTNVMLFLDCFKLLDENYYISNLKLIKKLSDYCKFKI